MIFVESCDVQTAYANRFISFKMPFRITAESGNMPGCIIRNIHRDPVFGGQCQEAFDMITMFVRNEYGFYSAYRQSQTFQTFFRFPAGDPRVDQYRILAVTDIITISIGAGIQRSNPNTLITMIGMPDIYMIDMINVIIYLQPALNYSYSFKKTITSPGSRFLISIHKG